MLLCRTFQFQSYFSDFWPYFLICGVVKAEIQNLYKKWKMKKNANDFTFVKIYLNIQLGKNSDNIH